MFPRAQEQLQIGDSIESAAQLEADNAAVAAAARDDLIRRRSRFPDIQASLFSALLDPAHWTYTNELIPPTD